MAQATYLARKNEDADFAALTCDSLTVNDATIEAGDIVLADGESITAGSGSDVVIEWDGTNFLVSAAADDSLIEIGDSAATQKSFDVKIYGNEANGASYLYFDASANLLYTTGVDIQIKDNDYLVFGTGSGATGDVTIRWDTTDLDMAATGASAGFNVGAASHVINTTFTGTLTVGTNGTGHDVTLYSATEGCSFLWDESEDQLVLTGPADVSVLKIAGAGSYSGTTAGTAWATDGTPAFCEGQKYLKVDVAGTTYRLPLWANS